MSKLTQIQNAIKALEGGKWQHLCNCYLTMKGYSNINSLGSVIGSDKSKKGTPDAFARQPDGRLFPPPILYLIYLNL